MPTQPVDGGMLHQAIAGFTSGNVGSGSFQPAAAAATTVTDANVPATANIIFEAANAAAGLLLRTKTCSIATGNSAGSFTFNVSATAAGAPAGTETFTYFFGVENPS